MRKKDECEICNKKDYLFKVLYDNGTFLFVCQECMDQGEIMAEQEYDRQQSEGII